MRLGFSFDFKSSIQGTALTRNVGSVMTLLGQKLQVTRAFDHFIKFSGFKGMASNEYGSHRSSVGSEFRLIARCSYFRLVLVKRSPLSILQINEKLFRSNAIYLSVPRNRNLSKRNFSTWKMFF